MMNFSQSAFQMPVLQFGEEDLQELFESFDPEKVASQTQVLPVIAQQTVEDQSPGWADDLQLFSLY